MRRHRTSFIRSGVPTAGAPRARALLFGAVPPIVVLGAALLSGGCRSTEPTTTPGRARMPLTVYTDASTLDEPHRDALRKLILCCRDLPRDTSQDEELRAAAQWVREAATHLEPEADPALAGYLHHLEKAMRLEEFDGLESAWTAEGPLLVLFSPSRAPEDGRVPCSLELALRDPDEHRWVDVYLERLAEFEQTLPLDEDSRSVKEEPLDRIVVGNLVFRGGAAFESVRLTSRFPEATDSAARSPRTFLFWKNLVTDR